MAPFGAAALNDGPAGTSAHPVAEAVLALTASYVWLISAFHSKEVQVGEFAVGARL
jgi:hypothetical protein